MRGCDGLISGATWRNTAAEVVKDELAQLCAVLVWVTIGLISVAVVVCAFILAGIYHWNLVVVFAYGVNAHFLGLCTGFELMTHCTMRRWVIISRSVAITSGMLTLAALLSVIDTSSPKSVFHVLWFFPVAVGVDFNITRLLYLVSSEYWSWCADMGSSVFAQQVLPIPVAIVIALFMWLSSGAITVARWVQKDNEIVGFFVNGLALPLASVALSRLTSKGTIPVCSSEAQFVSKKIINISGRIPGLVLVYLSPWWSFYASTIAGTLIEVLIDVVVVHFAVIEGVGGMRDILAVLMRERVGGGQQAAQSTETVNNDEGHDVASPPDAHRDTDDGAEEAEVDHLRIGIPLPTGPPPVGQHSAPEQQQEKKAALEGEETRDETYTDTDDDAERVQGDHLRTRIPPKSRFLAVLPGAIEVELPNGPPPSIQHSAPAQQEEKKATLEGDMTRSETWTSTRLRFTAHLRELQRRQEERLWVAERADKVAYLIAPAVAAAALAVISDVAIPWDLLLARAGIKICLEIIVSLVKGSFFLMKYNVRPSRAVEGHTSDVDLVVMSLAFFVCAGSCFNIEFAFYVADVVF